MPEHMAWGADCAPTCNCSAKCPHAVHDCEAGLPLYLAVLSGQVSFSGDSFLSGTWSSHLHTLQQSLFWGMHYS